MDITGLTNVVLETEQVVKTDLENKSVTQLFTGLVEEVGELARELNIEDAIFGNHNKTPGKDGSQMEAIDVMLSGLAMYFARGGDSASVGQKLQAKLDKWKNKQQEALSKRDIADMTLEEVYDLEARHPPLIGHGEHG
jgi:NTP pyrophosphatase (non-canonical NTP hydrolase)